jgi:hypothetical protein
MQRDWPYSVVCAFRGNLLPTSLTQITRDCREDILTRGSGQLSSRSGCPEAGEFVIGSRAYGLSRRVYSSGRLTSPPRVAHGAVRPGA